MGEADIPAATNETASKQTVSPPPLPPDALLVIPRRSRLSRGARGHEGNRIVLMGASLGTGVAAAIAATHEAAALVLEAPYLSALDVASAHYPFFPVSWLVFD